MEIEISGKAVIRLRSLQVIILHTSYGAHVTCFPKYRHLMVPVMRGLLVYIPQTPRPSKVYQWTTAAFL